MKVALVYDWVVKWGGAERVLLALHQIWPQAPLFTAVYHPCRARWAEKIEIIPSWLNHLPLAKSHHEFYASLMPLAFESFSARGGPASGWDFDEFDLVISVTSAFAKGIITKPKTGHICYCLTPTRFLWSGYQQYFGNRTGRRLAAPLVGYLRRWDKVAAQRPDVFVAISKTVQKRIKKYYNRNSEIIYPPVDTEKFAISHKSASWRPRGRRNSQLDNLKISNYYLVVSRLVGYKKTDLVVRVFNQLGWPLKIIGLGREMGKLRGMAKKNIEFLGQLTDDKLLGYYQKCRAVICPQEEDFGLVALEAQACGRPVIAFKAGGALETVLDGKTGLFFEKQAEEKLLAAVKKLEKMRFDPAVCRQNALRFSCQNFVKKIKRLTVEDVRK